MMNFKRFVASRKSNAALPARTHFRPSIERLEDRFALAGVTVITHGALPSLFGLLPFPKWPIAMGEAILDRADGDSTSHSIGSIYIHDQTSGTWKTLADNGNATTWNNSNSADEEIVLIYSWQAESLSPVNGMVEAAADNLFASLFQENSQLGGTVHDQRFIDLANRGNGELDLHLIGHSRGAVVNTLVAERFANYYPTWKIDQITSLDGHPAKNPFSSSSTDPYYQANEASIKLPTFDNVVFADAYYRTATEYQSLTSLDFSGVPVDGAHNVNLTSVLEQNPGNDRDDPTKTFDSNGLSLEHSDVHLWYQSTIQDTGTVSDGDISNFDPDAAGWFPTTNRSSTGFAFSRIAANAQRPTPTTNKSTASSLRTSIYNGDFAIGADTGNTIPGWQYHGGNHDADLSNGEVILGDTFFGDREYIRHNPFYISATVDTLSFDYRVARVSASDRFEIRIGDELVDSAPLTSVGSFHREAVIPNRFRDAANTVEFRIFDSSGIESQLTLDNVSLSSGSSVDFRIISFDVDGEPLVSGQTISTSYEIANQGNRAAGIKVQWYLSRDHTITADDRPISAEETIVLSAGAASGPRTKSVTLPKARDPIWAGDGTYYIGMVVDPENAITEVNEGNNANQGDGVDWDAVAVSNATGPIVIVSCGRGFVFSDLNGDDRFSAALDDAVPQTEVRLLAATDRSVVATTESSDSGFYEFANVTPGNYIITADRPRAFGALSAPEFAVQIVSDPSCENTNLDLGRLQAAYYSPRLFLASNRIGTTSRVALLKQILAQAESDAAPLHVNAGSPTVLETTSAINTTIVIGPTPSAGQSLVIAEADGESAMPTAVDDECELDVVAAPATSDTELPMRTEAEFVKAETSAITELEMRSLIFGPDPPEQLHDAISASDAKASDEVFATLDSIFDECENDLVRS